MGLQPHSSQSDTTGKLSQHTLPGSANAWRVVEMLEADERDQSSDPDWTEWTPTYRQQLARKIDQAYRGY